MKSFQKLVYFFSSKYYNNLKFSNRMLSTTRIFFERTTKNSHSLQALGNVYRNSKWSDLHVFNIKESSISQFKSVFYLVFLSSVVLLFLSRFNIQWTSLLIFNVNELFFYIKDLVSSWILFVFYTLSFIFLKVTLVFTKNVQSSVLPSRATSTLYKENYKSVNTNFNVGTSIASNSDVLLPSLYLQKLVKYLHLVTSNDNKLSSREVSDLDFLNLYSILKNDASNINYFIFFSNKHKFNNIVKSMPFFQNKEKLFYDCVDNDKATNVKFYKLNNNILKSLPFMFQKEFKNIISQNLNLGKENRWLMKNSLLSYDLITKASTTTHVKKLYGSNQSNSNVSSTNIWASNRLNGYNSFVDSNSSLLKASKDFTSTALLNNTSLLHLNNLEESFFWLVKRFKFLQTTNTYYQFEQKNFIPNSVTTKASTSDNNLNKLNLLKSSALLNTTDLSIYSLHNNFKDLSKSSMSPIPNELGLDLTNASSLTNSDLNFSKYFFNNVTLQKNNILIFSNLE